MGSGSGSAGAGAVKVVIINTQFVETDARSFKSVVQRLTGKDATIPGSPPPPPRIQSGGGGGASYISSGMSFRDFERMVNDLPSLDELSRIYRG